VRKPKPSRAQLPRLKPPNVLKRKPSRVQLPRLTLQQPQQ
jgi:hypothetical protein